MRSVFDFECEPDFLLNFEKKDGMFSAGQRCKGDLAFGKLLAELDLRVRDVRVPEEIKRVHVRKR